MKKTLTLIICLTLLQFIKANAQISTASTQVHADSTILPVINTPQPLLGGYQNGVYKRRLDSIKKDIQLDYNEYVQSYIELYMRNRDEMARVVGLSKYYFPI